jgi:hypothetical protein
MQTYTISMNGEVTLVQAQAGLALSDMTKILSLGPKGAVLDVALASRLGVILAFGLEKDLQAFKDSKPLAGERVRSEIMHAERSNVDCKNEVVSYLDGYERGQSADALLQASTGIQCARNQSAYPHDASDMGRCVSLYNRSAAVRNGFSKVSALCPEWKAIVAAWPMHLESHKTREDSN